MNVRFLCGEKKDLDKVPLVKGQILFITDEKIIYNSLGQRIDAIPYIKLISLSSEVSIPYIDDNNVSFEDTYSSSKIEDLLSWGSW